MIALDMQINFLLSCAFFLLFVFNSQSSELDTIIEIDNPKFSEKGLTKNAYEINAEKGLKSSDGIKLIQVEGKFKTKDDIWIFMNAEIGIFNQTSNNIRLEKNIHFYTDANETISSEFATYDIESGIIELTNNVLFKNNEIEIHANKCTLSNGFEKIIYDGNVLTKISIKNK